MISVQNSTRVQPYIFFLLLCLSCTPQTQQDNIKPFVTDITESVYASVFIKPETSYFPQPTRPGVIKHIWVEEGELVQKGQPLFQLSPSPEVKLRLNNASLTLQEMKENYSGENSLLLNIESELRFLQQQLTLDSVNLFRQQRLWAQNIGTKIDLERAELAYEATQNNYNVLQKKYTQTLLNLENQYKKALNQMRTEQDQLEDFYVRSEINGFVYDIHKKEGEFIGSQERFAEIGSKDQFLVEMEVDEIDITKVDRGDTVAISLDAYPNEVFVAHIHKIYPKKEEITQTFRVECIFIETPPKLYYGLSGEANVLVERRKNVLVIPSEYLLQGNKVLTANGEQSVRVGVKNMKFVEIVSGIDTTTFILKPQL